MTSAFKTVQDALVTALTTPATIVGSHARESTGDRQTVYVDLASIAAGASVTVDVTVTGVTASASGSNAAVIANPPSKGKTACQRAW